MFFDHQNQTPKALSLTKITLWCIIKDNLNLVGFSMFGKRARACLRPVNKAFYLKKLTGDLVLAGFLIVFKKT